MLFVNKSITDKHFKTNEVIQCTVVLFKITLATPKGNLATQTIHMKWALIILSIVLHRQLVTRWVWSWGVNGLYWVWEWELLLLCAMIAKDSQIPREGCMPQEEQIKQSLEQGLNVDNATGQNQWPSRWLFATTVSIR